MTLSLRLKVNPKNSKEKFKNSRKISKNSRKPSKKLKRNPQKLKNPPSRVEVGWQNLAKKKPVITSR